MSRVRPITINDLREKNPDYVWWKFWIKNNKKFIDKEFEVEIKTGSVCQQSNNKK